MTAKLFIRLVLILALLGFAGCENKKDKPEAKPKTGDEHLPDRVVEIIDGDTFVLADGRIVRLAMIDTPEKNEPLYKEAAGRLSSLIGGMVVELAPVGAGVDRYGRMLAEAFIDTVNVGRRLLYDGLGTMYLYNENKYLKEAYLPAQIQALDNKRGLWGLPEPVVEDFYVNIEGSFRFHRPLCPYIKSSNPAKIAKIDARGKALRTGLSPCRNCKP